MNKQFEIWGRSFNLEIIYDVYGGGRISSVQEDALREFVCKAQDLLLDPSSLTEYLMETSNGEIPNPIDNIFKYVMPKALFVKRSNDKRVIALLCNYKFDPEHGLAIVFENEAFVRVTSQADV